MFYIIEDNIQLQKFSSYQMKECFIQPILGNDNIHPALSPLIGFFVKPQLSKRGFMLMIDHSETFSLSEEDILRLFEARVDRVYTSDIKRTKYHLNISKPTVCLKTLQWLTDGTVLDDKKWNTTAHTFLYNKYPGKADVNKIVPVSKMAEKWNAYIHDNKKLLSSSIQNKKYFRMYNELVNDVLLNLELEGVGVDVEKMKQYYPDVVSENMVYFGSIPNTAYTHYNINTATGRPSNAFGGLNWGAMDKSNGSREFIIPSNTKLVEFDFHSYHPKMLSNLIGYEFEGDDIHSHLGRLYFDAEELSDEQYGEAKNLTFKLLYTNADGYDHIPFFQKVKAYKEKLWKLYREKGYLEAVISKRPITGIEAKTQILPYLLQSYETERNILLMSEIQDYLRDKQTKLVLYSYDAFLLDWSDTEGVEVLEHIQELLEIEGYKTSVKAGNNYASLKHI